MNPRNWSLRARLTALTVALLAVTSLVIGGVMALVVTQTLSAQFDDRLAGTAQQVGRWARNDTAGAALAPRFLEQSGLILAVSTPGGWAAYHLASGSDTATRLGDSAASAVGRLADTTTADAPPRTMAVPGYGEYRFAASFAPGGSILVGVPTSQLKRDVALFLVPIAVVVVAAIVIGGLLAAFILRRALRPLRRVATVATDVASMHLESGDVTLAERVPEKDTNPHTEVGQVGIALNNLLDSVGTALAVRQASEAKVRTFVADASHELRTPLAAIRGYAELTRRFGGELSDVVLHNIGRIESESQRMTSLVEDLLLLARLDAQRELDTGEVDLSRLLVDVVSDAHAAGRDHEWDLDLPDEPVLVRGDDARLHQVFANLLTNARVHTPGGTRVSVELRAPAGDSVTVLVHDTGPGIPEALQPTLFERFVRGDSSRNRNTGSTGLGLSIVNAVVQAHHGSVALESRQGSTTFTVRLPVHQPAEVRQPVPA